MPHLNHKGPEGQGSRTGRKLGKCKKIDQPDKEENSIPGIGLGLRRNKGGGKGQGKRLRAGIKMND
jgi:hypothetical protein